METILINGITGQDGAWLARLLVDKGYRVVGATRDTERCRSYNLTSLGLESRISMQPMMATDYRSVVEVISRIKPDAIYNLGGLTSVQLSFERPIETLESIVRATTNFLEAIRREDPSIRFYNACSGEVFGDCRDGAANENSPFSPRSPYAVSKATSFWEVQLYRQAYGLFACSGILFNHESRLRPERFVTRKIVSAASRIAAGSDEQLSLGDISVQRDWGWAPEYVDAMYRMLQADQARDYIVATGVTHSLESFLEQAFSSFDLDWQDHVVIDESLFRPLEIHRVAADPERIHRDLGWRAQATLADIIRDLATAPVSDSELVRAPWPTPENH